MVWHAEKVRATLVARTSHGNVLSLAHQLESYGPERRDYSSLGSIGGKLGHQAEIVASSMNASIRGESSGRTSLPKVWIWNWMADLTSASASS